ncbi:MAG TPA: basic amino acid ABC transporter substrate-binding protein [Anaerolineaceae bacterium]
MRRKALLLLSVVMILSMVLAACSSNAGTGASQPAKKIRVASEATYPPFETVDEKTKGLVGFDIDLMNAIGAKEGIQVEFVNTPFDSVLAGISTCQFDAAISAITITEDRKKNMAFSDPYVNAGQLITVGINTNGISGPADLKGKKISVQLGTTGEIEAKKIEGATVKPFDTADLAFLELVNGQVDAAIVDSPTSMIYVNKFKDKIKTAGQPFTDEHYGIAVCKKNTDLLKSINTGLAAIKADGTVDKLYTKWGLAGQK